MNPTPNQTRRNDWEETTAALNGGALFEAYEAKWQQGEFPHLDWSTIHRMLHVKGVREHGEWFAKCGELQDWIERSRQLADQVRPYLAELAKAATFHSVSDYLLLIQILDRTKPLPRLYKELSLTLPAKEKADCLQNVISGLARRYGREQTTREIRALFQLDTLLVEEREALVEASIETHCFNWQTLPSLSSSAANIALMLLQRGTISPRDLGQFPQDFGLFASGSRSSDPIAEKAHALSQQVSLPVRLTGAGLAPDELARLQANWLHPVFSAIALRQFRRGFPHPMLEDLLHFWDHEWPFPFSLSFGPSVGGAMPNLGVPLIRLMHMRLILEAPSLASSVAQPQDALAPEVMLYLLRNDGVIYTPTLYLTPGSERGWRRRWAEITGEALSCLFLMDALPLDLTTLRRIPESNGENTPDFQAKTFDQELIVFESKGATNWESFRKSKRKALAQLNKTGHVAEWERKLAAQTNRRGRSFACCLFATCGEQPEPSQFHVDDPFFAFDNLFNDGWEQVARRRHYTGVLQAAGLFQEAASLANGRRFEPNPNRSREIPLGFGDQRVFVAVGTERTLTDLAGPMGLLDTDSLRRYRIFQGIEQDVYQALASGELPPAKPFGPLLNERISSESRDTPPSSQIPPFGFIAERGPSERAGGVFSRMSNGSCLYVDWSQSMK